MPVRKLAIKPTKRPGSPHQLLLVGAGYAQLYALAAMIEGEKVCPDAAWVSPSRWFYPPGLIAGVISGQYSKEQCRIDLRNLAQRAGIRFIEQTPVLLDLENNALVLDDDTEVGYEWLSLDLGEDLTDIDIGADNLLRYETGERFLRGWKNLSESLAEKSFGKKPGAELALVGSGPRVVELALAIRESQSSASLNISLYTGQQTLLAQYPSGIRQRAVRELEQAGIKLQQTSVRLENNQLRLSDGQLLSPDGLIIVDTPALPPWLETAGLQMTEKGRISVDGCQRSNSHPNLIALGWISSRPRTSATHPAKVLAANGKVLSNNLLAGVAGRGLKSLPERSAGLAPIASSGGRAIGRFGPFTSCSQGNRRKQELIERRFIEAIIQVSKPLTD
ncbi:NAD(P)/FAD-dependent oxidoreductase [Marinobacterium lutimaris]|uniref:NADH dehydrogenase, FAD-containing subunit n=1 Tax=Marinobacterium lutimaris TaxID=568106 RepID=A0A1H5XDL7_9GAMM|nr:FAD-dependent oxidoreductase [Marinobacterium lutimaris]SEG09842.1 NADH dehydrogenase, FAD-containing subunit [Marinobacterium lutimaris]